MGDDKQNNRKPRARFDITAEDDSESESPQAQSTASASRTNRTATKLSPPRHSKSMSAGKQQRKTMTLPVSKKEIECSHMLLDAKACVVSPLNKRIQSLLTDENTHIRSLANKIKNDKQRDPVLARPITVDGKIVYEIIYGSCRRKAVELLDREIEGGLQLRAWVSREITDADAKELAQSENDDREGISAWEEAIYLKSVMDESPGLTQEALAHGENVDQAQISRYLSIAEIDESVIKLLASPNAMTLTSGLNIKQILIKNDQGRVEEALKQAKEKAPFLKASELQNFLSNAVVKRKHRDKVVEVKQGKSIKAKITKHRTNEGQYKVDIFELKPDDVKKLEEFIKNL